MLVKQNEESRCGEITENDVNFNQLQTSLAGKYHETFMFGNISFKRVLMRCQDILMLSKVSGS